MAPRLTPSIKQIAQQSGVSFRTRGDMPKPVAFGLTPPSCARRRRTVHRDIPARSYLVRVVSARSKYARECACVRAGCKPENCMAKKARQKKMQIIYMQILDEICMCVCNYVCMYVCMQICVYVNMIFNVFETTMIAKASKRFGTSHRTIIFHVCMYVCMYVRMIF